MEIDGYSEMMEGVSVCPADVCELSGGHFQSGQLTPVMSVEVERRPPGTAAGGMSRSRLHGGDTGGRSLGEACSRLAARGLSKLTGALASSPNSFPYSPITDLAHNLGETLHCYGQTPTPKRRLSLSSTPGSADGTPTFDIKPMVLEKQFSIDDGCVVDSPSPVEDSPSIQERFNLLARKHSNERSPLNHSINSAAYKRFQSMPVPFCGFDASPSGEDRLSEEEVSPQKPSYSLLEDENSQDSGVGLEKDKDVECEFLQPTGPAPRRARPLNDETNSPRHFSPKQFSVQRQLSSPSTLLHFPGSSALSSASPSPVKLHRNSLTHSEESDEGDDGFLDLQDFDKDDESVPSGLQNLLSAPVLTRRDSNESTPSKKRVISRVRIQDDKPRVFGASRRGLFRSPSMPNGSFDAQPLPSCLKRAEPCKEEQESTPRMFKRRKSVIEQSPLATEQKTSCMVAPKLSRCHSEAAIKIALNRGEQQPDLIGDFSKSYVLPLIPGKHSDLKSISPQTMVDLLEGAYEDQVENFTVVDCRYPYEFEGGHIQGAINPFTKDQISDTFVKSDKYRQQPNSPHKRNIIIFHCEFSSERGPKMSRFLRNIDRDANKHCYPSLNYPEVYLLDSGYKAFYEHSKELCEPMTYLPMLHEDYSRDLKKFRAKSKSWAGERSRVGGCRTGLKL